MEESKEKQSMLGTILTACLSVILMAVSALLLFVPQIELIYICYFVCGFAIASGIYMIVRYFMTDAFRNMNEYGFSVGTSLVLLGICGMLRAEHLAASFLTILGIALSVSGIIKLQYAMDLKRMKDVMWVVILMISMVIMAASMFVILHLFEEKEWFESTVWYTMLIDGGISLVTLVYMLIRVKLFRKKEQKEWEAQAAAAGNDAQVSDVSGAGAAPESARDENAGAAVEEHKIIDHWHSPISLPDEEEDVLQEVMDEMDAEIDMQAGTQQEENVNDVQ